MTGREEKITLIGAGLAGSLLSIYLARRGFDVEVYERRPDMRRTNISAGRSINLALSERGLHALREVGLQDKILPLTIPMKGRLLHAPDGSLSFSPYGRLEHEFINSISRGELNKVLMDAAESEGVEIHFEQQCQGINFRSDVLYFEDQKNSLRYEVESKTVIGTDGSASAIRSDMENVGRFNFSQEYLSHGYKELTIPPASDGTFALEKNALHIWPRHSYMLIALPNLDGSFTCTLFFPHEGPKSFASLQTDNDVRRLFENDFPDALRLMPTLLEDFFNNPTGNLVTIRCEPWYVGDRACLLGDAAHAIVPFFGQGMNCAFEDCTVLDACLETEGTDLESVFKKFSTTRKPDADAIAEMALENYYEMRDHVADPNFLLKREIEFALEERFPKRFIPRYSMVSFHRIPYAVAREHGEVQAQILEELSEEISEVKDLDWGLAERLVNDSLPEL